MSTELMSPRILLLSCSIVYQRIESRLLSLEPVMMQVCYSYTFCLCNHVFCNLILSCHDGAYQGHCIAKDCISLVDRYRCVGETCYLCLQATFWKFQSLIPILDFRPLIPKFLQPFSALSFLCLNTFFIIIRARILWSE